MPNNRFRYYCLFRPPMIGAVPRGMVNIVCFEDRRHVDEIDREAWGFVEYDQPLTAQQIAQYELAAPAECGNDHCDV